MATLRDSLVSSSARKLPIRKRPDLSARRQRYHGRAYWVVKDPVGLNYFRFQEEEWAILQMLDGESSLDEIKDRFEAEFPPQKITLEELQQFLGMLHRSGLIVVGVPGQGKELNKRRSERRRKELLNALTNLLCIRFKGIDPEWLLDRLYPMVRWFYSQAAVVLCMLFGLSALLLVLVEFEVFRSKLPDFYQFFSIHNAFWLAATLGLTKILHEFGHGMTCKHFGGECHEMGVMFLVLTPCLYCNVSDSWMLPNKWHRAAIGAAGMYVEVVVASIATYVWWFSEPGMLNNLALNTMFIASVSTVLFNANPLLRYDGYYILADITEIPNLRQKATQILSRKLGDWCLGIEPPEDPFLPEHNQIFFIAYTIAAVIYRWLVLFSILYFLYKIFEPYGLKVIGQAIVIVSIYALIFQPLYQLGKFLKVPGRLDKVKKWRVAATVGVLASLAAVILLVPMPFSVLCTLEVQARDAESVYIDVPGTLAELDVKPGASVQQGQPLAQLSNIDLDLEIAELKSQRDQQQIRLENLERTQFDSPEASRQIPAVRDALRTLESQLKKKHEDLKRLRLLAPLAGTILLPPWTEHNEDPTGQLPTWSGTPLDPKNLGSLLSMDVLFCQVGDPKKMEAVLVIDQADIPFVREGYKVQIKLDELPHDVFNGQIAEVSGDVMKVSSKRLSTKAQGELATKTDPSGVERPMSPSYQARVSLDSESSLLRLGLRGRAKIECPWQTVGQRVWRLLSHTFNFRL
jgi:putative peptide zinc metalloprotease protein